MNTKTTLLLAITFAVLGGLYFVVQSRPAPADGADATPVPDFGSSVATRLLSDTELGDVVKVTCQRKGEEPWVFEKETEPPAVGSAGWRMTSPLEMKCTAFEVGNFSNRLGRLKYEVSYAPGEPGAVTSTQAGLDPPQAVVTMTDVDGESLTVEIGKPASSRETYVRLGGSDTICVAKGNLSSLVKDSALDYREKRFWNFSADDVTRLEIDDRSDPAAPVSYIFVRDGSQWMMTSPVATRATSKVGAWVSAMGRLRAIKWHAGDATKMATYGLQTPVRTVRVTVEEEVPSDEPSTDTESNDETDDMVPETKVTVYELHVSDQSPIGEETNIYVRTSDESAVATVAKRTIEKSKPVMSEWREMKLTAVNVASATGIELTTKSGSATFVKEDDDWRFDSDGGPADKALVTELLTAVADLTAVAFEDGPPDEAAFGLLEPQAQIRLTVPGQDSPERITVGGLTPTKRLAYVRRNEVSSVGKVRAAAIDKLIRGPQVYRDRSILEALPSELHRLVITAPNPVTGEERSVTLARDEGALEWRMVEPVAAEVRTNQMDKLLELLGGLRAEEVVAGAEEATAYGLHAPGVTVGITYQPPTVFHDAEPPTIEGTTVKNAQMGIVPDPATFQLAIAVHDGKYYARREKRPTVYRVTQALFDQLGREYRSDRILDFAEDKVERFSIQKGDQEHVFQKQGDRWVYQAEPDLPLDATKVKNLLLQIRDLRCSLFARYDGEGTAEMGLETPVHTVTVTVADSAALTLRVSSELAGSGPERGHYATASGTEGVFLLTPDSLKRIEVSLANLEAK